MLIEQASKHKWHLAALGELLIASPQWEYLNRVGLYLKETREGTRQCTGCYQ